MAEDTRAKFLSNIRTEANCIRYLVDHMLELSELENKRALEKIETLSFGAVAGAMLEQKGPLIARKNLKQQSATTQNDSYASR